MIDTTMMDTMGAIVAVVPEVVAGFAPDREIASLHPASNSARMHPLYYMAKMAAHFADTVEPNPEV